MHRRLTPADKTESKRAGSLKLPALFVLAYDRQFRRSVRFAVLYTLALWFAGIL